MKLPDGPEPRRFTAQPRRSTGRVPVVDWDSLVDKWWWIVEYPLRIMKFRDRHYPWTQRRQRTAEQKYRLTEKGKAAALRKWAKDSRTRHDQPKRGA